MPNTSPRRPRWFLVLLILLTLWALAGVASWVAHLTAGESMAAQQGEWDLNFFRALPPWFVWDYGVATVAALAGTVALWARSRHATPLYLLSLVAVVIQFGYVFAATDLLAHKGVAATVPFPLFIGLMGVVQVVVARWAGRSGWLR